eukprot:587-Prorocentrum_minimum.AAC.2
MQGCPLAYPSWRRSALLPTLTGAHYAHQPRTDVPLKHSSFEGAHMPHYYELVDSFVSLRIQDRRLCD